MGQKRETSPTPVLDRAKGVVHVPAERGEERVEELDVELFFFVVAGEEDLAVLAEMVYEAEKGVGGRTHRREDSGGVWVSSQKAKGKSQNAKQQTAEEGE
jgi:hypothetical protein